MHDSRSISSPDVKSFSFYYQPSSVASYHDFAMSVVMIRCTTRNSGVVVAMEDLVNHGLTISRNGRPVDVVIAAHRGWQRSMGSHHSEGICKKTGRHGY